MPRRVRKSFKVYVAPKGSFGLKPFTKDELDWFESELRKIAIEKFELKDKALDSGSES